LFRYLPYGPFAGFEQFREWLDQRAASTDPLFYAIVDGKTLTPQGMASYLRMVPEHGVIEIGHIWFAPALQRTRQATEAIYLMARHVFDDLGYRRLEWKCDALNEPSRRAAERFGFTFEGVFRQHLVVKGHNRDSAWFSMLDGEWPVIRAAFEAWLAPLNFDADGRQRESLAAVRDAIRR
jgi:RimJ/RimL family protein N-acetyltransferase